jgi:D-alanyl-lipoteichoic acid acyltransferase DltB (MBOAT superfamily)
MLFNSISFIFFFLPAVAVLFYVTPQPYRVYLLLCVSLVFYSYWDVRLTPLLIGSILVNYVLGSKVTDALVAGRNDIAARFAVAGVALNLGVLAFFKYRYFVADIFDFTTAPPAGRLIIPLAISF